MTRDIFCSKGHGKVINRHDAPAPGHTTVGCLECLTVQVWIHDNFNSRDTWGNWSGTPRYVKDEEELRRIV